MEAMGQDPIGREGQSVRLREATLADAAELDARPARLLSRGPPAHARSPQVVTIAAAKVLGP